MQRISLRQLAEKLGLSPTTVSRAINGFPEVSENTRRRVLDMAERMGYQADRNAQRLAKGTTRTFAIVLTSESGREINPLFGAFIGGITEYLTSVQYDLLISPGRRSNELEIYQNLAAQKAVDGFIISSPKITDPRIKLLEQLGAPYVVHGRSRCDHPFNWIDVDNTGSFRKATQLLIDYGHTRIAYIGEDESSKTYAYHRFHGYCSTLEKNGFPLNEDLIVKQDMTITKAYQNTQALLRLCEPPTAFLCSSIFIGVGVTRAANEARLRCPDDYSLIAYDDQLEFMEAENFLPPLTTIQSSIGKAGYRCAEILHRFCVSGSPEFTNEQWPVDLILRDSVGPVKNLAR